MVRAQKTRHRPRNQTTMIKLDRSNWIESKEGEEEEEEGGGFTLGLDSLGICVAAGEGRGKKEK